MDHLLFGDLPLPAPKRRSRGRDGTGKSKKSYIKHSDFKKAVRAQVAAYRCHHHGRIILIDGNAGDGMGVTIPEEGFFALHPDLIEPLSSLSTAELLMKIAEEDGNADVILCERDAERRAQLAKRFPKAHILKNNSDAIACIQPCHRWGLWISDPCGPKGHNHKTMAEIAKLMPMDFIIALNEGWITGGLKGTEKNKSPITGKANETARQRYMPMLDPHWWRRLLSRKYVSRSRKTLGIAPNFKPRILIVANFLSDGAKRSPFELFEEKSL